MQHHHTIGLILGLTTVVAGCTARADTGPSSTQPDATSRSITATLDPTDDEPEPAEPDVVDQEPTASPDVSEADPADAPSPAAEAAPDSVPAAETASAAESAKAESETAPPDAAPPSADPEPARFVLVPGANVSIESVEADGQRFVDLACQADSLPLLGSLAVVASIAEHKRALDRCAPKGGAVAVTWTFRKGKARDLKVHHASSERVGACVAKTMRKVVAPFGAQCGTVVLVGDTVGADEALAQLRSAAH